MANFDGVWLVKLFGSNHSVFGEGILVLRDGSVHGGDHGFFYEGTYQCFDGHIKARLTITNYARAKSTLFGSFGSAELAEYTLTLEGTDDGKEIIHLSGCAVGHEELAIEAELQHWLPSYMRP